MIDSSLTVKYPKLIFIVVFLNQFKTLDMKLLLLVGVLMASIMYETEGKMSLNITQWNQLMDETFNKFLRSLTDV